MEIDYVRVYEQSNLGLENSLVDEIRIYPNPSSNICYIELNDLEPIKYLSITDTKGKTLLSKVFNFHEVQLDISLLKSGLYFIRIETPTKTFIKRLIKK